MSDKKKEASDQSIVKKVGWFTAKAVAVLGVSTVVGAMTAGIVPAIGLVAGLGTEAIIVGMQGSFVGGAVLYLNVCAMNASCCMGKFSLPTFGKKCCDKCAKKELNVQSKTEDSDEEEIVEVFSKPKPDLGRNFLRDSM